LLNYYTDDTKKRLKGTISLDDCEQVEHGLVDRKGNYDYMFSINTRSRSYFLAVDSRREMDTWVNMVCKACGLKENADEVEAENSVNHPPSLHNVPIDPKPIDVAPMPRTSTTSNSSTTHGGPTYLNFPPPSITPPQVAPPVPPAPHQNQNKPSISNPYIHISECFSGKPGPPLPPPRQSQSGNQSKQPTSDPKKSTGSHRHDSSTDEEQIYFYMPSNATIDRNGKASMIMIPAKSYEQPSLAYIDLDLPKVDDDVFTPPSRTATINKKSSNPNFSTEKNETIYKEVDFEKTKAWNLTRKDREGERIQTIDHRTS